MFFIIQVREVFDIALSVKDIRETAVIIVGHANVGHHAAAVVHFAARFGRILLDQRIGYGPYAAVFGPMRIVDRLDAASAGGVVFGSGEFQVGVVADRAGRLYEPLAERALTEQYAAVEVLESSRYDLCGRGRGAVDQHGDWNLRVDRFALGNEGGIQLLHASPHRYYLGPFGDEHREDFDRLLQDAAAVPPQVDNQSFDPRFFHRHDSVADIVAAIFGKIFVYDVTDAVVDNAPIRNARHDDPFPLEGQFFFLAGQQFANLQV